MKKLYRSRKNKKLCGLCGGLAERFRIDSTVVRLIVLISIFFSGGTAVLIYFLACLIVPKEPELAMPFHRNEDFPPRKKAEFVEPSFSSELDEMMNEIETKAMRKELQELRAKLAKFEQEEK